MRFSTVSVIAVYAATFASAHFVRRDVWSTYEKIGFVQNSVFNLTTLVKAVTSGTPEEFMAVSSAAKTLQTDYEGAHTEASEATELQTASSTIYTYTDWILVPQHANCLKAFIAKEPLFKDGGHSSSVRDILQSLLDASAPLWDVLDEKISLDMSGLASAMNGNYTDAIAAYS